MMLGLVSRFIYCCAECRYAECHYAVCRYPECRYPDRHYPDCRYPDCRYPDCRYTECRSAEFHRNQGYTAQPIECCYALILTSKVSSRQKYLNVKTH